MTEGLVARNTVERLYFCRDCWDEPSAWQVRHCPAQPCGRVRGHQAHSYAERCHCWQQNPEVARRKQKLAEARA